MMRYREKEYDTSPEGTSVHVFCTNHVAPYCPQPTITLTWPGSLSFEGMEDVSTPDYQMRIWKGEIINSPYLKEKISLSGKTPTFHGKFIPKVYPNRYYMIARYWTVRDELFSLGPVLKRTSIQREQFFSQYNSERDVAIAKAFANMDVSEINALASLGELPETLKWLGSLYKRALAVLILFKSRKARLDVIRKLGQVSGKDFATSSANLWMELRYAIRPLIFEMDALVAALEKKAISPRQTARGTHKVIVSDVVSDRSSDPSSPQTFATTQGTKKRESTYRAGVMYSFTSLDSDFKYVFGLDKPVEAMLELTRLSFVLEWFFNIGDVLAAHTTESYLTSLASWCTEIHHFETNLDIVNLVHNPDSAHIRDSYTNTDGWLRKTHSVSRRITSISPPVFPSFRLKLDWKKIVDLAIIARQIYRAF